MKQLFSIVLICIGFCLPSFGQKTAQEYFNISARLYAEKQQESALYTVSRGCELFESDSSLAQLKRLIEGKNNQKNNQQNSKQQDNNNENGDQAQQQKNENGQNNQQQNQQQKNQPQQNAQDVEKDENQNKKDENQPKDQKGQISEIQANMLLDAIDNDDKAIQQRLKLQRQNKQNQNNIEKNW